MHRVALALDFSDKKKLSVVLSRLDPKPKILKIGLQTVSALGIKESISLIKALSPESDIFLDLKLHDIPNTVSKTIENFRDLGIKYATVHALGGRKMLTEANKAAENQINIIAVTVLTSHSSEELNEIIDKDNIQSYSLRLAYLAKDSGITWFVSSAHECTLLKSNLKDIKLVTPGIRLPNDATGDQSRIMTPSEALKAGSDMLVIGRPIYDSQDPAKAWDSIIKSCA